MSEFVTASMVIIALSQPAPFVRKEIPFEIEPSACHQHAYKARFTAENGQKFQALFQVICKR